MWWFGNKITGIEMPYKDFKEGNNPGCLGLCWFDIPNFEDEISLRRGECKNQIFSRARWTFCPNYSRARREFPLLPKKKSYDWARWPSQSKREGDSSPSHLPQQQRTPSPVSTMFADKGTATKAIFPPPAPLSPLFHRVSLFPSLLYLSLSHSLSLIIVNPRGGQSRSAAVMVLCTHAQARRGGRGSKYGKPAPQPLDAANRDSELHVERSWLSSYSAILRPVLVANVGANQFLWTSSS